MVGFTDSAYTNLGQVPDPDDAQDLVVARSSATAALGPDLFASEYEVGASWDATAAFALTRKD